MVGFQINEVIDLSMPIDDDMPFYPGDPEPHVCGATSIAQDGFNVSRVNIGSHTGTHCDAPFHFLEDGARLDELPLDLFCGPAVIVDVSGRSARSKVTVEDVKPYEALLGPGVVVFIRTGWSANTEAPLVFDHPYLTGDACAQILASGVRTIGIDALSLDETPTTEVGREAFPCHSLVSHAGGVIVENLINLDRIGESHPFVSFFPLNLARSDGAPVRAVALNLRASG